MELVFNIRYRTKWGEVLKVAGNIPELGNDSEENALPLTTVDGDLWTGHVATKIPASRKLTYHYIVCSGDKTVRSEWTGMTRVLCVQNRKDKTYTLRDSWKDIPECSVLFSSAFTGAWLGHDRDAALRQSRTERSIIIKAAYPCRKSERLFISGSNEALGCWDTSKAIPMNSHNYPEWLVEIDADALTFPFEYKFICKDTATGETAVWESGSNRYFAPPCTSGSETIVVDDLLPALPVPHWRGSGINVPVFSLKTEGSFGVGDFGDLQTFIRWAAMTGQKIVQLLPVYDTTLTGTWTDSYPYNSISIYALHPMYLDLRQLPPLRDKRRSAEFGKMQKSLNALEAVDYEAVNHAKREYAELSFHQDGKAVLDSEEFERFFASNESWLVPYAAFSVLRDTFGTADFHLWPEHSVYDAAEVRALCSAGGCLHDKVALYYYVQFFLDKQLAAAGAEARAQGLVLKGDIPIGISRNSVDAWTEPQYFNMDSQAGAPPDDFSANGQNWGFPTYNWNVMKSDGYAWWTRRLRQMSRYFDAYRIDHVLGFFRIWQIPLDSVHGLLGQFSPSLPMSEDEIRGFGFHFDAERDTHPYIHESFLADIFGSDTEFVKTTFLTADGEDGTYCMKPEFSTQRKVEAFFASKTDDDNLRIREGLYSLISNVLFVRDHDDSNLYHPRIAAQNDYAYHALDEGQQAAFNNLYNNYYYHRHNRFWGECGMEKLPVLIDSTAMLACGEDLGMIPDCVPAVMDRLHILSLEVQRMPKIMFHEFANTRRYPYLSVCTPSTHDMSTLRFWWTEDANLTQLFFTNVLGHIGKAPAEATPEICEEIIHMHLDSPSMLCIPLLQDWLAMDAQTRCADATAERINVPAIPRYYWRYRMPLTIESLIDNAPLNSRIARLISRSGR